MSNSLWTRQDRQGSGEVHEHLVVDEIGGEGGRVHLVANEQEGHTLSSPTPGVERRTTGASTRDYSPGEHLVVNKGERISRVQAEMRTH